MEYPPNSPFRQELPFVFLAKGVRDNPSFSTACVDDLLNGDAAIIVPQTAGLTHKQRKENTACFIAAETDEKGREDANVKSVTLAIFDIDKWVDVVNDTVIRPYLVESDIQKLVTMLDGTGLAYALHTSYSHEQAQQHWRLFLFPDGDILPEELPFVRDGLRRMYGFGPFAPEESENPSRLWFLRCVRADMVGTERIYQRDGGYFDTDAVLAWAKANPGPVRKVKPKPPVTLSTPVIDDAHEIALSNFVEAHREKYVELARARIALVPRAVQDACWEGVADPEGITGSKRCLAAARICRLYALSPGDCMELMLEFGARAVPVWDNEIELAHKLDSCEAAFGGLVEDDFKAAALERLRLKLLSTLPARFVAPTPAPLPVGATLADHLAAAQAKPPTPVGPTIKDQVRKLRNRLKKYGETPNRRGTIMYVLLDRALKGVPLLARGGTDAAPDPQTAIEAVSYHLGRYLLPLNLSADEVVAFLNPSTRALSDRTEDMPLITEAVKKQFLAGQAQAINLIVTDRAEVERMTGVKYE